VAAHASKGVLYTLSEGPQSIHLNTLSLPGCNYVHFLDRASVDIAAIRQHNGIDFFILLKGIMLLLLYRSVRLGNRNESRTDELTTTEPKTLERKYASKNSTIPVKSTRTCASKQAYCLCFNLFAVHPRDQNERLLQSKCFRAKMNMISAESSLLSNFRSDFQRNDQ